VNRSGVLLACCLCAAAHAQTIPEAAPPPAPPAEAKEYGRLDFKVDPDVYSIVSSVRGLSTHKATYFFPATWSHDYDGNQTEMVFQVSAKWSVFGTSAYLAYSQRSFWQWLNNDQSSPFRETNYDPEIFYRWIPDAKAFNHWGADLGFEHESNGREFPFSRSWNRIYVAPFQAKGKGLFYLKGWYRVPEGERSSVTNQDGDDNPDIVDYYGYGELTYSRQIGGDQLLTLMGRGNPDTGRGAAQLTWSVPSNDGWVFWALSVFHGYGESLVFYDHSITRVMLGAMLAR
jgi:phospholipase A1/A2